MGTAPPSNDIVLFDAKSMDKWVMAKDKAPSRWVLDKGVMTVKLGKDNLQTKQKFGDCQLHVEFKIPADAKNSANRNKAGNSGVFLQERYEVQIFNSYQKIQGTIQYIGIPKYELHDKASVRLQVHGSSVSFRNIWIREI